METLYIIQAILSKIMEILSSISIAGFNLLSILLSILTINIITTYVIGGKE